MKIKLILLIILQVGILTSCNAQKMMETLNDAKKLETNSKEFIGFPLSKLLKEIGPQIVMVYTDNGKGPGGGNSIFFKFNSREQSQKAREKGKTTIGVKVYVKEDYVWDKSDLPIVDREKWTKEDAARLGSLTVMAISVYGEVL